MAHARATPRSHQQSFRLNTSLQPSGTNPINIKPAVIREISQSLHSRALLCLPTRPKLPLTRALCVFNLGTSYKAYVRDRDIKLIPCEPQPCRQSPTPLGASQSLSRSSRGTPNGRRVRGVGGNRGAPVKARDPPPGDPHCFCGSCSIRLRCHHFAGLMTYMQGDNVSHQKTQPHVHSGGTASLRGAEETKDGESPAKGAARMRRQPALSLIPLPWEINRQTYHQAWWGWGRGRVRWWPRVSQYTHTSTKNRGFCGSCGCLGATPWASHLP